MADITQAQRDAMSDLCRDVFADHSFGAGNAAEDVVRHATQVVRILERHHLIAWDIDLAWRQSSTHQYQPGDGQYEVLKQAIAGALRLEPPESVIDINAFCGDPK